MICAARSQIREACNQPQYRKKITEVEVQRIIELRLNEDKSCEEVASELGRTLLATRRIWRDQCLPLLSEEERNSFKRRYTWTPEENKHLLELHRRGNLRIVEVALQFPSKSLSAVQTKALRELMSFERPRHKKQSGSAPTVYEASAASDTNNAESGERR